MTNTEIIYEILKLAEEKHLDLYHDVTKRQVFDYVKTLKDIDTLTPVEFDRELCKLFALFRDAHTFYEIPIIRLSEEIIYIQGKMYLKEDDLYHEIIEIEKMSAFDFLEEMSKLMSYEVDEYLYDCLRAGVKNAYYYQMIFGAEMLGVNIKYINQITQEINTTFVAKQNKVDSNKKEKESNYQFKIIDRGILYFKYKKCFEHKEYPFLQFMKEVEETVQDNKLKYYILDLRNNHGGDSEIINSFQDFIKNNKMKGVILVNNGTFSSGRTAVARFKKLFNPIIIGEPTGGAIKSFGYSKHYEVEGKKFTVSVFKWDFSRIFGYTGAIQPDIPLEQTIEDLRERKDRQLDIAIKYIQNKNDENFCNNYCKNKNF